MLFRVIQQELGTEFKPYRRRSAGDIGVSEKDLENWVAMHPDLLFGTERILVIGQSISGHSMADIIGLDGDGRLVVIEMKRDWSDRATVGQLLEYAARISESTYDQLNGISHSYWFKNATIEPQPLIERFREFFDAETEKEVLGKAQRLLVVAPASDEELRRIVGWLKKAGIAIDFVPFSLYSDIDGTEIMMDIEPIAGPPVGTIVAGWKGDWFFNTNETYAPGAYKKMFEQGAIAIYGYETGPQNLQGSETGQRVFAYVNRRGVMGIGRIVDGQVIPGSTIFGEDNEFHLRVKWESVVPEERGVSVAQVSEARRYNLPVRSVFCGINRPDVAEWLARELATRASG